MARPSYSARHGHLPRPAWQVLHARPPQNLPPGAKRRSLRVGRAGGRSWITSGTTLRDVRFTHAWGGPLGMPRDWHPSITFDRSTGVASARGYIGHGVSTANLAGRTLAELLTEQASERTELPLVGHRSRSWEPEPFRWIGVRYAQWALGRIDAAAERTQKAPSGPSLARWMARH